ncbi:ABC transporter permease [bacterium]|nr:ABC transporter permease [bacterium]
MQKGNAGKRILNLYGGLFFLFIYLPIALIFIYSFNSNPTNMMVWRNFTLDWYRKILGFSVLTRDAIYVESTDQLIAAVKTSLTIAMITTAFSTLMGTATAIAINRFRFRLKKFYQMLMFVPMIMPDIVLGIALLIFYVGFGIKLGALSIIIGHCTFLISYVFIVVSTRLAGMDKRLEEASADLGANEWVTFRRVVLPLIMPGVVGGALLAFIISMDDLVITLFIAGVDSQTLPLYIYGMLRRGIKPEINAIASLMLIFSLVVASLGIYFRSKQSK